MRFQRKSESPTEDALEFSEMLTPEERHQILKEFNPSDCEYPREKCLHELFEEQVIRTPEGTAVRFAHHSLSYRELNERANQVAHFLKGGGVGPETLVGICLDRSCEMIVGVLGILKAGGAYVPLESDEAQERLAFKMCDSGVKVLLTEEKVLKLLPPSARSGPGDAEEGAGPEIICMDRDRQLLSRQSRENPSRKATANNLAYVIYTSGSTGTPKGVLVDHRCVVSHSIGFARRFNLSSEDRVLQFAPLSFDVSAEEIFPALATGGTLLLRPAGLTVSIEDFHPFVIKERVTVLNLPTPYWSQWMTLMEEINLSMPASLRLVVAGSDTVTKEQYARWQKLAQGRVRWCNAYGTTEATITATIYEPDSDEIPHCVPIGRPIENKQVYILDEQQQPVPIGVAGEIYIGGDGVARGYLNRPEATQRSFVPDRFSGRKGARLNRTGDFGRWRADGNIEFLGRRDNQVKIRGFRIELGEVESALLQHPAIKEVVVLPREDERGEKRLVAWFVAKEGSPHFAGKLLHFTRERLPAYMIPAVFVPLPAMPRLSSGKVDVKALPTLAADRPDLEEEFVAPVDSLEEKLADVWRKVLGLEKVGVNDNFFNLGGHSLLAVRLMAAIENVTGCNLPLLTLFQCPTVRQLAEAIRRARATEKKSGIVVIQGEGKKTPLFLVHGAGGGMLWGYANLAAHMGTERPVCAFNSPAAADIEQGTTIEQMAAQYVQELREAQPKGPYCLGGYCFGGEVAFEMAQQLTARGERVELLALFNSMPPNSSFEKIRFTRLWAVRFICNSWHWFRYFRQWNREQRRSFLQRKLRTYKKWLRGNETGKISAEDQIDVSLYSEEKRRLWDMHLRASANYQPKSYQGRITLFRTQVHPFFCSFDPTFGWGEFAREGVTVRIVPGGHESILAEPHVRAVAAELNANVWETDAQLKERSAKASKGLLSLEAIRHWKEAGISWFAEARVEFEIMAGHVGEYLPMAMGV